MIHTYIFKKILVVYLKFKLSGDSIFYLSALLENVSTRRHFGNMENKMMVQ